MPCPSGVPFSVIQIAFSNAGCRCLGSPYNYVATSDTVDCAACNTRIQFDANGLVLQVFLASAHGGKSIPVVPVASTSWLGTGQPMRLTLKDAAPTEPTPEVTYKDHFLLGIEADGASVVEWWGHTPTKAEVDEAIAGEKATAYLQFVVVNPTGIIAVEKPTTQS